MSTARRNLIRPANRDGQVPLQRQRRLQTLRARLERERSALARWQTRLRRAFNAAEKSQKRIVRLEREITKLEES